jgi:hypothetical protein
MTHTCHWPGCGKEVAPKLWGCKKHWFMLPAALRSRIWATYRPGQEIDKTPSPEYMTVVKQVQEWIKRYEDGKKTEPDWNKKCMVCAQSPIVPMTGMCGPCTFGEADTAGGNW